MTIKEILKDAYRDGMTVDEINEALASTNLHTDEDLKNAVSKANTDASNWKKKYHEALSEDERLKAENEEKQSEKEKELNDLKAEVETLKTEKTISENTSKFLALGYEKELAEDTAKAMAKGDISTVFANQAKHLEAFEKKIKADVLKGTPKPTSGNGGETVMTLEKLRKLSPQERYKFSVEHPEEYKNLYGGTT